MAEVPQKILDQEQTCAESLQATIDAQTAAATAVANAAQVAVDGAAAVKVAQDTADANNLMAKSAVDATATAASNAQAHLATDRQTLLDMINQWLNPNAGS